MPHSREPIDGRHAIRLRNYNKLRTVAFQIIAEGNLEPTAEQIADRAEVSARSVWRHFDTLDQLIVDGITAWLDGLSGTLGLPAATTDPFGARVHALVEQRLNQFEEHGQRLYAVYSAVGRRPQLAERLYELRSHVNQLMSDLFAHELAQLDEAGGAMALAGVHAATLFEVWRFFRHERSLDRDVTAALMRRGVTIAFIEPHLGPGAWPS